MTTVLLRPDAGPSVGLGHLQRCISLAVALQRHGFHPVFLTDRHPDVQRRVRAAGFDSYPLHTDRLGSGEELQELIGTAEKTGSHYLVVDSYFTDTGYLEQLQKRFFVAAIDDMAKQQFPCQLVISPGAHADKKKYRSVHGDTVFLLGTRYAMVRPEFWSVPQREIPKTVSEILILLGGTDRHRLMPQLLGMLDKVEGSFSVTAVIGPFFEERDRIQAAAGNGTKKVCFVESPETLFPCISRADLAITAAGQTLYELAAAGCPSVAIRVAENQREHSDVLADQGAVHMAGAADDPDIVQKVRVAAEGLLSDRTLRASLSVRGRKTIDGQGALRVVEEGFARHGAVKT